MLAHAASVCGIEHGALSACVDGVARVSAQLQQQTGGGGLPGARGAGATTQTQSTYTLQRDFVPLPPAELSRLGNYIGRTAPKGVCPDAFWRGLVLPNLRAWCSGDNKVKA